MPKSKPDLADLFGEKKSPLQERKAKNFVLNPGDIERVELCPASRVFVGPKPPMHPGMWFGIFVHRFLEYCVTKGRAEALAYISRKSPRLLETCKRLQVDDLPENGLPEMELALDLTNDTADAADYDMAKADSHVFMRTDLVYLDDDDVWNVWDYKTGNNDAEKRPIIVAKRNVQLKSAALALSLLHDVSEVRGTVVTIDTKSGELRKDQRLYKSKELRKHKERLRLALYETLETRAEYYDEKIEPDIAPAPDRCYGCRARSVCHGAMLVK